MRTIVLTLTLGLVATVFLLPSASAERITGCVDGDGDSSDCFLGREVPCGLTDPDLSCVLVCVRECTPPLPGPDCLDVRECGPPQ